MRLCPLLSCLAVAWTLAACAQKPDVPDRKPFGGDPHRGRAVITRQACGACHVIPGIEQSDGEVGPPLDHFAQRTVIAGVLPNTPPNLVRWLQHPQAVTPGNAMPEMGLTETQARDVAAYLYTLR